MSDPLKIVIFGEAKCTNGRMVCASISIVPEIADEALTNKDLALILASKVWSAMYKFARDRQTVPMDWGKYVIRCDFKDTPIILTNKEMARVFSTDYRLPTTDN